MRAKNKRHTKLLQAHVCWYCGEMFSKGLSNRYCSVSCKNLHCALWVERERTRERAGGGFRNVRKEIGDI